MSTPDESRGEYDFREGTRGRHARRLRTEGPVIRLDADVAERFPTSESVNAALRALVKDGPGGETA